MARLAQSSGRARFCLESNIAGLKIPPALAIPIRPFGLPHQPTDAKCLKLRASRSSPAFSLAGAPARGNRVPYQVAWCARPNQHGQRELNRPPGIDPVELDAHRTALMRFAVLQVRDGTVAEDLVQETLLAALTASKGFTGGSSVRTWLTGILRHKIIDHFRRAGREQSLDLFAEDSGTDDVDAMFRDGRYVQIPADWGDPERLLSDRRFMEALERCVQGLPVAASQAFLMRELMGFETEEICKELGISATNCWVLLHRGRMRLRACLEKTWVGAGGRK